MEIIQTSSASFQSDISLLSVDYFPLQFINISVIDAPLLKDYYWSSLKMSELTDILLRTNIHSKNVHNFRIPSMPIYSRPMRIVFHMKSELNTIEWHIKRIKLCKCKVIQIPIGISKFQNTYNCMHRKLLDIEPRYGVIHENEMDSMCLYISYDFVGEHELAFEMTVLDAFKIRLNFKMEVFEFDPFKCFLNKQLTPVYFGNKQNYYQPIWIYNPFTIDLNFKFETHENNLKLNTKSVNVEKQCIRPLVLEYQPNSLGNQELNLIVKFVHLDDEIENLVKIDVKSIQHSIPPSPDCPDQDIPCKEAPFILYKNSTSISLKPMEVTTRMIIVHNHHDICVQYKWKNYSVQGLFNIEIQPPSKFLKPKRATHFIVKVEAFKKPCIFHHIPVQCEIFDGEKILKQIKLKSELNMNLIDEEFNGIPYNQSELSLLDTEDNINLQNTFIKSIYLDVNVEIQGKSSPLMTNSDDENILKLTCKFDKKLYQKLCNMIRNFIFNEDFANHAINSKDFHYGTYETILKRYKSKNETDNNENYENFEKTKLKFSSIDKNSSTIMIQSLLEGAVSQIASERVFIPVELALPFEMKFNK